MRRLAGLASFLILITPLRGATRVTVAQLEQFLTSSRAATESDAEIADRLSQVALSEELTAKTLARINSEAVLGPRTTEQLELLAGTSMFVAPPAAELPNTAKPSAAAQKLILKSARDYVNGELHLLPDFLAVRATRCFDNVLADENSKSSKPKDQMRFVREYRSEIAFRNGREVNAGATGDQATAGLSTWGEFGAILTVVLDDSFNGSVAWSRWHMSESGAQVAVFHYTIPRGASHYTVDFCCYQKSRGDPEMFPFRDKPGYSGEIHVDAESGAIDRITLDAELNEDDPVTKSGIAVQYGSVNIGGKRYICPVRGVAVSEVHNLAMKVLDGVGLEKHVNEVQFLDYHKFGSTARIVTGVNPN